MMVTLSASEALMASYVGCQRRVASLARNCRDRHGYDGKNAWEQDVLGALAEFAVAKALDMHWSGSVNAWKRPDLGRSYQVRVTTYADGRLLVRDSDPLDDTYILVVQLGALEFRVAGQIAGRLARNPAWWSRPDPSRPGCWCVPQTALAELG